jgi:type II secretory pathway component PulL
MKQTAVMDLTARDAGRLYLFGPDGRLVDDLPLEAQGASGLRLPDLPGGQWECMLSLPVEMLDFRVLHLPFSEPARVREVLPFELDGLVLGPPREHVADFLSLGPPEDGKHPILAVYARTELVRGLVEALQAVGLDPRSVTSIELALARGQAQGREGLLEQLVEGVTPSGDERREQALAETRECTVNLRRGDLVFTREARLIRRNLKVAAMLALVLVLVLAADLGLRLWSARTEAARLERSITATYADLFPGETVTDAEGLTYRMAAHLKELKRREAAWRGVAPLDLMMKLESAALPGVAHTEITLDGPAVSLTGTAGSLSVVQELVDRLKGVLPEVALTGTEQVASDRMVFTVTARAEAQ